MLTIAHLTDPHLSEKIEREGNWHDTRSKFLECLAQAKTAQPDILIVTGDVLNDQNDSYLYPWFFDQLEATEIPYRVIAGNHDEGDMLGRMTKKETDGERILPWAEHTAEAHLLFIDTASGTLHANDLDWLEEVLATANRPVMLFMHHPPVKGYHVFMDTRYGLTNTESLQMLIKSCPQHVYVFCGHYHLEKTVMLDKWTCFISPATYYQISDVNPEYEVTSTLGGWRLITLDEAGVLSTRCRYQ